MKNYFLTSYFLFFSFLASYSQPTVKRNSIQVAPLSTMELFYKFGIELKYEVLIAKRFSLGTGYNYTKFGIYPGNKEEIFARYYFREHYKINIFFIQIEGCLRKFLSIFIPYNKNYKLLPGLF